MTTEEADIYEMVYRIEDRIGVIGSTDNGTITAELSAIRGLLSPTPYVEVDMPITGDNFTVQHVPILVGDSAIVNGHAIISLEGMFGTKRIEEWRDISFDGKVGTIVGANGRYDGKEITLTYFYSQIPVYAVAISDGFMTTIESNEGGDDVVISDMMTGDTYKLLVSWDKTSYYSKTRKIAPINDIITDLLTGVDYRIFLKDGVIEYEEV